MAINAADPSLNLALHILEAPQHWQEAIRLNVQPCKILLTCSPSTANKQHSFVNLSQFFRCTKVQN